MCHERKQHPEDVDYIEISELYATMKELDAYFGSDDFKRSMFGDTRINKYEYQPIVRTPEINEGDDGEYASAYKPPYIKLKIDIDNTTDRPSIKLYNKSENGREVVVVDKFKDITDHMKYLTKVRFVVSIHRLHVVKTQIADKKRYGICIKIIAAECENKAKKQLERTGTKFVEFFD